MYTLGIAASTYLFRLVDSAPIMPLCHRRRSNSVGIINYCYSPFRRQLAIIILSLVLLLLPAIIDGTNIRQKYFRTIWQRRRVGGIPSSFVPRVSRGGGPAVVLSVTSDANETDGMENNVTIPRTSTTAATPPPPLIPTLYVQTYMLGSLSTKPIRKSRG